MLAGDTECMDSSTFHPLQLHPASPVEDCSPLPPVSNPLTPSVDVQIYINDVTMVPDDVSMTSDSDSCRSELHVARRQRRRLSWCPEHSDDKQRLLGVSGRRFDWLSAL